MCTTSKWNCVPTVIDIRTNIDKVHFPDRSEEPRAPISDINTPIYTIYIYPYRFYCTRRQNDPQRLRNGAAIIAPIIIINATHTTPILFMRCAPHTSVRAMCSISFASVKGEPISDRAQQQQQKLHLTKPIRRDHCDAARDHAPAFFSIRFSDPSAAISSLYVWNFEHYAAEALEPMFIHFALKSWDI